MRHGKASISFALLLVAVSIRGGLAFAARPEHARADGPGILPGRGPTFSVAAGRNPGHGSRVVLAQAGPAASERSNLNLSKSNVNRAGAPNPGPPVGAQQPQGPAARADACEKCRQWCTSRCVPPGPGEKDCVCIRSEPN